jgi:dTMP kinase
MIEGGRGLFIVFEGVEGSGKSTHVRLLSERLLEAGVHHRVTREPGGTATAERIRSVVLDPALEIGPEAELLLILAARAEFVRDVVEPSLARGEIVLADRYELSTYAYQGIARGLGLERVRELNAVATGGLKPDAILLLEVDSATGLGRKETEVDRMESEDAAFHEAVEAAYRHLAETEPDVIRIDTSRDCAVVEREIDATLVAGWPAEFGSLRPS